MIINKGYIKKSNVHGYGVFAKEDIKEGDIVEQAICPTQIIEPKYEYLDGKVFIDNVDTMSSYRFSGPNNTEYWIMPSGNAIMYNHSFVPNIIWNHADDERAIIFTALKDIKKDEELLFDYGPKYKYDRRNKIKKDK